MWGNVVPDNRFTQKNTANQYLMAIYGGESVRKRLIRPRPPASANHAQTHDLQVFYCLTSSESVR